MNDEEKALLEKTAKMSEENNRMLRRLVRESRLGYIWMILKIAVFAVPIVVGYFYLLPFVEKFETIYNAISSPSTSAANSQFGQEVLRIFKSISGQ